MKTKFKFELGELVRHSSNSFKMLVVSRFFEESKGGTDEKYVVSYFLAGEPRRVALLAEELQPSE